MSIHRLFRRVSPVIMPIFSESTKVWINTCDEDAQILQPHTRAHTHTHTQVLERTLSPCADVHIRLIFPRSHRWQDIFCTIIACMCVKPGFSVFSAHPFYNQSRDLRPIVSQNGELHSRVSRCARTYSCHNPSDAGARTDCHRCADADRHQRPDDGADTGCNKLSLAISDGSAHRY